MRSDLQAFIDVDRVIHNYRVLRACCGRGVGFCAPLKANAYGHGAALLAPALQQAGVDWAAVANIDEAVELRAAGWRHPILVLGNVLAVPDAAERRDRIDATLTYDLTLTVPDDTALRVLTDTPPARPIDIHLKIDTGLGRMGVLPDAVGALLDAVAACPHVRLRGIYSHFGTADFEQLDFARSQLATFQSVLASNARRLPSGLTRHLSNSAATIMLPEAHFDLVRPGIALYGYPPAAHMGQHVDLRPSLRLMSHLALVKDLPAGHSVGYARKFVTRRPTRIGIVPIGYADGFIRAITSRDDDDPHAHRQTVSVRYPDHAAEHDAPVIGRVSMDQIALDLTDLPPLPVGSPVTLISDDDDRPHSVCALARRLGTISYEITCLLGRRIDRVPVISGRQIPPHSVLAAPATSARN